MRNLRGIRMPFRPFTAALLTALALLPTGRATAAPAPLTVVGVLGNSSGLSNRPVPYAYYTGMAADARGRLYLSGAAEGIPVCDQDGLCLAVLPLPDADGMITQSFVARAGDALFVVARKPGQSALYRIDAAAASPADLKATRVITGRGHWALAPQPDAQGRILVGQSEADKLRYTVVAVDPGTGANSVLFALDMPKGATPPWQHLIQSEPDGSVSIQHAGGVNWNGRYSLDGKKVGDAAPGLLADGFRYRFGYGGGLQRFAADGSQPAPGECGAPAPEIRQPAQVIRVNDRYFFAGRGGAVEARWNGQNFVFERRLGALYVEDMVDVGDALHAIAYTAGGGNQDVQHFLDLAKTQPIGEMLDVLDPVHSRTLYALVRAPEGAVVLARDGKRAVHVQYEGRARHLDFDVVLPEVKEVGQAAIQAKDLLFADPATGTLWRRPLLAKEGTATAWGTNLPGVTALAVSAEAVFVATATQVSRLSVDGNTTVWTAPVTYKGVRRLAAAGESLYVCDAANHVVDQLSSATGELKARLGVPGQPGFALDRLNKPWTIAADLNGVTIADNGNGRVLVATTTLWRPEIPRLPREDRSPLVAAKVPVTAPAGNRLSVNIYDENDLTVRQLACAQPSDQPVLWDGRDMYGQWAKPGRYRYHAILAPKLSLRYITSIGQSGNPPYRTEDGKGSWGGVWGNVMDVCTVTADPMSDIVVLWAFEEGEGGLIRMSQDGEVRWKQHLDWWMKATQMAVASDGTFVYITGASAMNAPEGQTNYQGAWNRPLLWRVDAASGAKKLYSTDQNAQPMFGEYKKEGRIVTDLAVRDGKLYLTAPAQDTLFVIAADSAKQLAAWSVKDVSGVTFDQAGRLLAGSGDTIVELDPADGKLRRTMVAKAGGPVWSLATTPAAAGAESAGKKAADDGFFATLGEPRHQVAYFSAKGKEKRTLGVKGGRPLCGKMQPESFREPVGFCVAGNGKLFVAENATPRRFSRWAPDGKLEREFHGPYYLSGMFGIDEEQPELVYGDTHSDLIRYRVDYETGKWGVEHYWIKAYEQAGVPIKWWPRIRHRDGKVWWCSGSGAIAELQENKVRGVAAAFGGWVEKKDDGSFAPVAHNKNTGMKGTWSDLNGDGKQQPEEWQVTNQPTYSIKGSGPQQGWGCYFDENFNLYMHDWSDQEPGGVWKLPVTAWTNGVPVYRWDQAQYAGRVRTGPGLAHGSPGARTAFAYQGAVFGFNGGYNAAGLPGVGHGHDWEFAQITKYDEATGRPLWHAGERCAAFVAPGQHYCPTGAAGVVGDYLFWTDENSLVHVWDMQHGLYVDTLLEDGQRGPVPSPYTVWVELFNTRVFKHPRTGKVYLLAASDAIHVYELLGAEQSMTRLQGEFELTEAGLRSAQQRVAAATAPKGRTMTLRRPAGAVTVDGELAEFAKAESAKLELRNGARGTIRIMADDTSLYLGADVEDESPWKNAGGDVTALFKTGDEVSLWLGPSAGKRPAGEGDLRLLFAPDGKGGVTVVLYRAKLKDGAKPVSFRSPSGEVRLDKVEVITTVPAVVKVTDGGYRLEAAVPWSVTGLTPAAKAFGLDVSINFSDPAGQRNVARLHWGRNGAALVYDLPSEARLEPETWGVGEVENVQR